MVLTTWNEEGLVKWGISILLPLLSSCPGFFFFKIVLKKMSGVKDMKTEKNLHKKRGK